MKKPVILCILDGWGHAPASDTNAVSLSHSPNYDFLMANYPHGLIEASESFVGLPKGQMGNSEVGHMHLGAGRVLMQDLPRIDDAIATGALAPNDTLQGLIANLKSSGGTCHLMGLCSDGGVHAHQNHIIALAKLMDAQSIPTVIHAFMDGRDTAPRSGLGFITDLAKAISELEHISIATVSGRYYAMDRDNRWDRVEKAYTAMRHGKGETADTVIAAIEHSYGNDVSDEFVLPTVISDYQGMQDGDALLMANFRADRAREIVSVLCDDSFDGFAVEPINWADRVGMVSYSDAHDAYMRTVFPPQHVSQSLGEVISGHGLKQLRIAETEKYAHVTFFLNGGREAEFDGEDRILVPSPNVATYDVKPEMACADVTDKLIEALPNYDLCVVNFANTDMVGHTGSIPATVQAIEAVDACLGRLMEAAKERGAALMITADHGNAEMMHNAETGQAHTAHTMNPVPFIVVDDDLPKHTEIRSGSLVDVAPTVLATMGIALPAEMTGESLVHGQHE